MSRQMEDVWHQGRQGNLTTGIDSLKPKERERVIKNIKALPYYHYRLHRTDVEALIREDGDFILRHGTRHDPHGYALSVRWGGRLLHFPIQWVKGQCCFEDESHELVQNLIHHHYASKEPVTMKTGAKLLRARSRQTWELLQEDLQIGKRLGTGAFGSVFEATWTRPDKHTISVAVKTLDKFESKPDEVESARVEMLREARIMRELCGHPNLVRALGVMVDQDNPYTVLELMNGGELRGRVQKGAPLSVASKVKIALEIARGASYINRSGYVHRDLSARNVLLTAVPGDEVGSAKIGDFGLARKLDDDNKYEGTAEEKAKFPVCWSPIETLLEGVWYETCDVWSMGVVIWEIFSGGAQPYYDLENQDRDVVLKALREGFHLEVTDDMHMPPGVKKLLSECWRATHFVRPPMQYVCWQLQDEWYELVK